MHLLRSLATGGSCDFTSGATGVQPVSNRICTTGTVFGGLTVGATTWGCLADVIGRKLSWQITLFTSVRYNKEHYKPCNLLNH